jgi:hypothetical protein
VSGGLRNFLCNADHQTLDEASTKQYADVTSYLEKLWEQGVTMFARIVKCQSKAGRSEQVGNKLENDVLPILQKQLGFVDFLTLSDKNDPEKLVCISFWTLPEGTEQYDRQHYYSINDTLRPLLESPATLEVFEVNASTARRIALGRAA